VNAKRLVFGFLALLCASATLFFAYYGTLLVYTALTFEGEGSLGHVGMYIAAGLFPFLALVFAAFTYLAWRSMHRKSRDVPPHAARG
jgi:hypothetical protein